MSAIADSRERVLERIRAATGKRAGDKRADTGAGLGSGYIRRGELTVRARHERFMERLREYDAEVVECDEEELPATIAAVVAASGRRRFVAPPGVSGWIVEPAWKIEGFECVFDHELPVQEIEQAEGVITACFCGIADSGTIVLHHSDEEGRRVLTLLPDWHLCVVRESQVVETLPEYFDKCREQGTGNREQKAGTEGLGTREQNAELPRLVTWISGPSATADIEMTRIKGVHGPRFLNVILVRD
jgi:L-lactate dehydrogenase complex protein LldG